MNGTNYWIGSRNIMVDEATCDFCIGQVAGKSVTTSSLYSSIGSSSYKNSSVRPIVSIPLNSITIKESTEEGIDYKIVY